MTENTKVADINYITEKTETVRITFEGEDYLKFNNLFSRLIFKNKLSEKKSKEGVIKLAFDCLGLLSDKLVNSGVSFIHADASNIINDATKPEVDYEDKFLELQKLIIQATGIDMTEANGKYELNKKALDRIIKAAEVQF